MPPADGRGGPSRFHRLRPLLTTAFLLLFPAWGFPHAGNVSYSQITVQGRQVRQQIRILVEELLMAVPLDRNQDGTLDQEELEAGREELTLYLQQKVEIISRDVTLPLRIDSLEMSELEVDDQEELEPFLFVELIFEAPNLVGAFSMRCRLLDDVDIRHDNFAKIIIRGQSRPFVFTPYNTFVYDPGGGRSTSRLVPDLWSTFNNFALLGAEHIFSGYDHILFLIGLLLVAARFSETFKVVTAFTIAHSFSLALAALEIIEVSSRIVEPFIALSIMYVAAENFFSWFPVQRWMISFGFGLIHGLAFAQGLQVLDLPKAQFVTALLSFNVGIEMAQVLIVAVTFPLILAVAKVPWRLRAIQGLSAVLFLLGTLWLIERVLV